MRSAEDPPASRPSAAAPAPATAVTTAPPRTIVLTNTLMRDSGGASQALDLALAARAAGVPTSVAVTVPPLFGLRANAGDLLDAFALDDLLIAPRGVARVENPQERLTPLRRLRRQALAQVRAARQRAGDARARRRFAAADVVVSATDLSHDGFAALRRVTGARVLLSHTGSVDAFRGYWLAAAHVAPGFVGDDLARYRAYVSRYDALLFEAPDQRDECVDLVPAVRGRAFVVRPAVGEAALDAARAAPSPFPAGRRAVVNVGSVQPRKAQHLSIAAFAAIAATHPDVDLHLVGELFRADYVAELRHEAASFGLAERVLFHGHRDDYDRCIAHADVLVHSSLSEGVSRVLREAMVLARPIVAFDLSGTRDALSAGVTAWLAPTGDAAALADGLRRVLGDADLARRLGAAAAARYREAYGVEAYRAALRGVLGEVAGLVGRSDAPTLTPAAGPTRRAARRPGS